MAPYIEQCAEEYRKGRRVKIAVVPAGSIAAIEALVQGKCAIAAASCRMPQIYAFEAAKKGIVTKEYVLGYDAMLIIVHPYNKINNLFLGQVADMYRGLLKDWKEAEGAAGVIVPVDRDARSGARMAMHERFFELTESTAAVAKKSDAEVVEYVSHHRNAIGYVSRSGRPQGVKVISINGIQPTDENVEKGYYPLRRELYLYGDEKRLDAEAVTFIDFMCESRGRALLQQAGFVPPEGQGNAP